jgi:hypothetical protein
VPSKLFQKRKAEAERRAERAKVSRSDQKRILVVAEGSKTEPNYIAEFIRLEGLGNISPFLTRDNNTAPTKLLEQARRILLLDKDFDLAFVISDRDEFPDFLTAMNAAPHVKCSPNIRFIYSDPCFELWLLFHFEMHDGPIDRHQALKKLQTHISNYEKGSKDVARMVYNDTDKAIENSKIALSRAIEVGNTCPSTLMHELILTLRACKVAD